MAYDLIVGKTTSRDWSLGGSSSSFSEWDGALEAAAKSPAVVSPITNTKVEVWTPKQAARLAKVVDTKIRKRANANKESRGVAAAWNRFKKKAPKNALADSKMVVALKGWNAASDRAVTPAQAAAKLPAVVKPIEKTSPLPALLKVGAAVAVLGAIL